MVFNKNKTKKDGIPFTKVEEIINSEIDKYTDAAGSQRQEMPRIKCEIEREKKIISVPLQGEVDGLTIASELIENLFPQDKYLLRKECNIKCGSTDLAISPRQPNDLNLYFYNLENYGQKKFPFTKNEDTNIDIDILQRIVTIEKEEDFTESEVYIILNIYKKSNIIEVTNPKQILLSYGAEIFNPEEEYTWDRIAGYEDIKKEVMAHILFPLKYSGVYDSVAKQTAVFYKSNRPKAVLFEGPPGTGKTLTGKIIASQSGIPMVYLPVEAIMSKWYGESENRLAKIFDAASDLGNSVFFIDEVDSLATSRNKNMHEATRRVLGVLLRKLDGLKSKNNTIALFATNRKDDLDPALLRRISASIYFRLPKLEERTDIYRVYAKHLNEDKRKKLAKMSEGMSGSDIEELCKAAEREWIMKRIREQETAGKEEDIAKIEDLLPPVESYIQKLNSRKNIKKE